MGRLKKSKTKLKLKKSWTELARQRDFTEKPTENTKVPIENLPEKFLWMHIKNGTKMRNVIGYALKEFAHHDSIVWTGAGQCMGRTISCAEFFKRKHKDLHQVTKLCYTSKRLSDDTKDTEEQEIQLPEIHILLTRKNIQDTTILGYQAPGDCGEFPDRKDAAESKTSTATESAGNATFNDEEFAAMGLRPGQKRKNTHHNKAEPFLKKNKKSK